MTTNFLVKQTPQGNFIKEIELQNSPEKMRVILNDMRWKILESIAERPKYPAEIAKEFGIYEQKVYYHINQLRKAGVIELVRKEEKEGALAKYFTVKYGAFGLELPFGEEKPFEIPIKKEKRSLTQFLNPFVRNGRLNSFIVVGSPDPHGPNQVRARDSHYAIEIGLFLGQYASLPKIFSVKLDVDVKAEKEQGNNMVLVGGVLTNTLTSEINAYLPVKFESKSFPYRAIISEKTRERYEEDTCGFVAKIKNPFNSNKSILILAGTRFVGTKSAVMALTHFFPELLESYRGEDNWARIVKGVDMDGDGKVDHVEFLE